MNRVKSYTEAVKKEYVIGYALWNICRSADFIGLYHEYLFAVSCENNIGNTC